MASWIAGPGPRSVGAAPASGGTSVRSSLAPTGGRWGGGRENDGVELPAVDENAAGNRPVCRERTPPDQASDARAGQARVALGSVDRQPAGGV